MPCVESRFTVASTGNGPQMAYTYLSQIATLISNAGGKLMHRGSDHSSPQYNEIWKLPQQDAWHTRCDYVHLHNGSASGTAYFTAVADWDVQDAGATMAALDISGGWWISGTWPSAGSPRIVASNSTQLPRSTGSLFNAGLTTIEVRAVCSEYGVYAIGEDGTGYFIMGVGRPMGDNWPGRVICVPAVPLSAPPHSYTFAAPSGVFGIANSTHLRALVDGRLVDFAWPTGVGLGSFRTAQEMTMQAGGFAEGDVRGVKPDVEQICLQIPPDRAPSAGVPGAATNRCGSIAIVYQDPEVVTAGLDFALKRNLAPDAAGVATGARGSITATGADFLGARVRIGSYVYNRDIGDTARVVAFGAGGTVNQLNTDVIVMDTVPGSWTDAHTYDVYPYVDQLMGATAVGGMAQAVVEATLDQDLVPGADTAVLLHPMAGEALGKLQDEQTVLVMNNGGMVILTVDSVAGALNGDIIVNNTTGALGIVRGIDAGATKLAVDTISNATNPGAAPWNSSDTVSSSAVADNPRGGTLAGATISAVSSTGSRGTKGWGQLMKIVGDPTLVDAGNGDYRLRVVLDTDDVNLNPSFAMMPGFALGINAKRTHYLANFSVSSQTGNFLQNGEPVPSFNASNPEYVTNQDVRREEVDNYTSNEPPHTPDYSTGSIDSSPTHLAQSGAILGSMRLGTIAHLRTVNIVSNGAPSIGAGDDLFEDQDAERRWYASNFEDTTRTKGATTAQPAVNSRVCIGPGSSALIP